MNPLARQHLLPPEPPTTCVAPRTRLAGLLLAFGLFWLVVLGRCIQLELTQGEAFRSEAIKPLRREIVLPAQRGRIVARDGSVLAADEQLYALAMHYRYLQREPEAAWLRSQARRRLSGAERRDRQRVDAECLRLRKEIVALNRRLATLCDLPPAEWQENQRRIEAHVETMAAKVNARRWEQYSDRAPLEIEPVSAKPAAWWNLVGNLPDALRALGTPEPAMWEPVVLKEQVDYHILVENIAPAVAATIRQSPEQFPGVRILEVPRRTYPHGELAANVLGHLQNLEAPGDSAAAPAVTGAMGLEKSFDTTLTGKNGVATERTDRRGRLLATDVNAPPTRGTDVRTTLDAGYQQAAEALLDHVLARSRHATGGAAVLLDVRSGDVLVLASAPRFDPNAFALGDDRAISSALHNARQPLFDRSARMALPPGGLMQPFAAVAMIESNRVPAQVAFQCTGQLSERGDIQCAVFQQQGEGHGPVTMTEAIRRNCRVYFAHYAATVGLERLVQALQRFGFGTPTGMECLPEASGTLPEVASDERARAPEGTAQLLAIGQGSVSVTPLQMACAMAALAGDGRLQTPRLLTVTPMHAMRTGISPAALALVKQALEPTAPNADANTHSELSSAAVAIAGVASAAAVGRGKAPHSWCAGYFPAGKPKYAFAVVIEHGGEGSQAAAPVARRLAESVAQREDFATSH